MKKELVVGLTLVSTLAVANPKNETEVRSEEVVKLENENSLNKGSIGSQKAFSVRKKLIQMRLTQEEKEVKGI